MATIKELQEKIAKLEKGINSKATSSTAKAKMRTQVKNFKSDIINIPVIQNITI
jgi:O-acetylhomoserine/O-acetylserine sulfhydrylase-like pyridoxal-dependent enzyme